jgi:hypothetical protein
MSVKALKFQLQVEHSKKNTNFIVQEIQAKNLDLKDVFKVIKKNETLFSQRAAWVISSLSDQNNYLLKPYYQELISLIDSKYHDAVLRATFRILSTMKILEKDQGFVFETGINFLNDKHTAVAIKAWAIDVLMQIATPYPELQNEILLSIKPQLLNASSGLKGKILKTIQKINDNFEQASLTN